MVSFDKDAVYIDIGKVNYTKKKNLDLPPAEGEDANNGEHESDEESEYDSDTPAGILKSLQDVRDGVDEKMEYSTMRLFKGSKAVKAGNSDDESDEEMMEEPLNRRRSVDDVYELANSFRRRFDGATDDASKDGSESSNSDDDGSSSSDENSDNESVESESHDENEQNIDNEMGGSSSDEESEDEESDDEEGNQVWKTDIAKQAAMNYLRRERSVVNLQQLVYGNSTTGSNVVSDGDESASDKDDDSDDDEEEFFTLRDKNSKTNNSRKADNEHNTSNDIELGEHDSSRNILSCKSTGPTFDVDAWLEEGDDCLIERIRDKFVTGNWGSGDKGNEDEEFDDFEDLETGEKYGPNGEVEESDEDETAGMTDAELREFNAKKKANQKNEFDDEYDESKKGGADKPSDEKAENEYVEALKREKEARLKRNQEEFG